MFPLEQDRLAAGSVCRYMQNGIIYVRGYKLRERLEYTTVTAPLTVEKGALIQARDASIEPSLVVGGVAIEYKSNQIQFGWHRYFFCHVVLLFCHFIPRFPLWTPPNTASKDIVGDNSIKDYLDFYSPDFNRLRRPSQYQPTRRLHGRLILPAAEECPEMEIHYYYLFLQYLFLITLRDAVIKAPRFNHFPIYLHLIINR